VAIRRLDHINFLTCDAQASIAFYCDIIGLKLGERMSVDTAKTLYFYIEGVKQSVLHIGQADIEPDTNKFRRKATLTKAQAKQFSTGSFDHFCLLLDFADYDSYVDKFRRKNVDFQTYCHQDIDMKQIWLLDPNGVRVELNFVREAQ